MMKAVVAALLLSGLLMAQKLPLRFEGNDHISDGALFEALGMQEPWFYEFWKDAPSAEPSSLPLLAETVAAYYRTRGYLHVAVAHETADESAVLRITERPPLIIADIAAISMLPLDGVLPFATEDIFDAELFGESKLQIKAHYAEAGYCNARLDAKAWVDAENDRVYLTYEVTPQNPCRFGAISIEAPEDVEAWIIGAQLDMEEGDPYTLEALRRSYAALNAQEGLSSVRIDSKGRKKDTVPISVSAESNPAPVRLRAGAGYSSDEGPVVQGGVRHANLYGNLKSLGLRGRYSPIRQEISLLYTMPITPLNTIGAETGFSEEQFEGYRDQSIYAKGFVQQRVKRHAFEEAVIFDRTEIYASKDPVLFPEEILFITSGALEWFYDRRDRLLEPTAGYFTRIRLMGSSHSALSSATYTKATLSGGYLYSLGEHVFGIKGKLGSLRVYDGRVPVSYRYYAGGMNSNRAYRYRRLGPENASGDPLGFDSLAEGSFEWRFPVAGNFRGVLFSDVSFIGQEYAPDATDAYTALGLGVRYKTPIGPIALDAGFDVESPAQYAIHFHIGELF